MQPPPAARWRPSIKPSRSIQILPPHRRTEHAHCATWRYFSTDPKAVRDLYSSARQAAERAVALAPDSADAHMTLGWHVLVNGYLDFTSAAPEIDRAMALATGQRGSIG